MLLFALLLSQLPFADPPPGPIPKVKHPTVVEGTMSTAYNDEERWLLARYGGSPRIEATFLRTSLHWQMNLPYAKHPGGVDQAVLEAQVAAAANRGKLGPLDLGDLDFEKTFRVAITVQRLFNADGQSYAASTAQTQIHQIFNREPAVIVSSSGDDPGDACRHELLHVARLWSGEAEMKAIPLVGLPYGIQPKYLPYYFSPREIDPRLATIRRSFTMATGNPVRTAAEASSAWAWARLEAGKLPQLYIREVGNLSIGLQPIDRATSNRIWLDAVERSAAAGLGGLRMTHVYQRMTQLL